MRRSLLLLTLTFLLGVPFAALAAVDSETRAIADGEDQEKVPWRGTMVVYEQATTFRTLTPDSDLTYNPVYVHNLSLRPEWHVGDKFFTRLRFDLEQEITNSDSTTKRNELEWSDLFVELGTLSYKEENTGIVASGLLRLTLPVSKASVSRTLLFGASPTVHLTKSFNVLDGLIVRYSGRYSQRLYDSKTGEYDGHGILGCRTPSCDSLINTGIRNSPWDISHGPMVMLIPTSGVALTTMMQWSRAQLYALSDAEVPLMGGTEVVAPDASDPNARYASVFLFDASWSVMPELTLSGGLTTFAPQLQPDATRYNPFFNRHSMIYVNLGVHMDALISNL